MDIRQIVKEAMAEKEWRPADVVRVTTGKIPPATLYDFLRGKSPINSDHLGHLLETMGLFIGSWPHRPPTPVNIRKNAKATKTTDRASRRRPITADYLLLRQVPSDSQYLDRFEIRLRGRMLAHLVVNTESSKSRDSDGFALHYWIEECEGTKVPPYSMRLLDELLADDALVSKRIEEAPHGE